MHPPRASSKSSAHTQTVLRWMVRRLLSWLRSVVSQTKSAAPLTSTSSLLGTRNEQPARSTISNLSRLLPRLERNSRWPWMLLRLRFLDMEVLSTRVHKLKLYASMMINLSIREFMLMADLALLVEQEAFPIYLNFAIAPLPMSVACKDET